jgi:ERCC4-type nuclease
MLNVVIDAAVDRRMTFRTAGGGIWWNTARTAAAAASGFRTQLVGPLGRLPLTIFVDSRERYPYRFEGLPITVMRQRLLVGDYVVAIDGGTAAVERKGAADFVHSISTGQLAYVMDDLATLRRSAVVVESAFTTLPDNRWCSGDHLVDVVVTLSIRYPHVQIVFAGSRSGGELWTARWLAAATAELASAASPPWSAPHL